MTSGNLGYQPQEITRHLGQLSKQLQGLEKLVRQTQLEIQDLENAIMGEPWQFGNLESTTRQHDSVILVNDDELWGDGPSPLPLGMTWTRWENGPMYELNWYHKNGQFFVKNLETGNVEMFPGTDCPNYLEAYEFVDKFAYLRNEHDGLTSMVKELLKEFPSK